MIIGALIILLIGSMFFFTGLGMFLIVKDEIFFVFMILGLLAIYFGLKGIISYSRKCNTLKKAKELNVYIWGTIISQEDDSTFLVNGVPACKVRIEFTDDCVVKEKEFQTYSTDYDMYKVGKQVKVYKYNNEYYWDSKNIKEDTYYGYN